MEIGAVSRQELERVRTDRVVKTTDFDAARTRLTQLGMSSDRIEALLASGTPATTVEVVAPSGGTVVAQQVTQGQAVDVATPLFTIADLSSVWIGGDLPEREFARVQIGSPATAAFLDVPDAAVSGTVIFIDPQINASTHTARIRVEVANPSGQLKAGMAADVEISEVGSVEATLVPRDAVQNVNSRQVVYLAPAGAAVAAGTFVEHEVHLGPESGDRVAVTGVTAGDRVVVKGSTFLRTERERLGLRR
jgi:RND family efflux transporter MFP subunit